MYVLKNASGAILAAYAVPKFVPLGAFSLNGPWQITAGANVSVIARGRFA